MLSLGAELDLSDIDRKPVDDTEIDGAHLDPVTRCAVYRFYHSSGALLYVGVANDLDNRFRTHAENSPAWWWLWSRYHVAWYPDRHYALGVEAHAIVAEHPGFNIAGRGDAEPLAPWSSDQEWSAKALFERPTKYQLDVLFGQKARTAALDFNGGGRLEMDPDVAHRRYEIASANAGKWTYIRHRETVTAFHARERAGQRLLGARCAREDRLESVRAERRAKERAAEAEKRLASDVDPPKAPGKRRARAQGGRR